MRFPLLAFISFALLTACSDDPTSEQAPDLTEEREPPSQQIDSIPPPAGPALGAWGIDMESMDLTIDPGHDFYRFVNGNWLEQVDIPAGYASYGIFTEQTGRSNAQLRQLILDAAKSAAPVGSPEQKIGDLYLSYMQAGIGQPDWRASLAEEFDRIDQLQDHADLARLFAQPHLTSLSPIGFYVDIDVRNPDQYAAYLKQGQLGLPSRDFYLYPEFSEKRQLYKDYLVALMELMDVDRAAERAMDVLSLESRLADAHWPARQSQNPDLTYPLYTLDELESYAPDFPWDVFFDIHGIPQPRSFILRQNEALRTMTQIFANTTLEVWQDYLRLRLLSDYAEFLGPEVENIKINHIGHIMGARATASSRQDRAFQTVNRELGDVLGKLYVRRHFSADHKAQVEEIVQNLELAFERRLEQLDWMQPATKDKARQKLALFTAKIGYPDEWPDYSPVDIRRDDAFGNALRIRSLKHQRMVARLGQPFDQNKWSLPPQTVTAYYSRRHNKIMFPAAILQPPLFDPLADKAVNYGAIGAVIGHEIGHGFDNQGRLADGRGLQQDWWSKKDSEDFEARAAQLATQYAQYSPLEGYTLNTDLIMDEVIGDLGGLMIAYEAYKPSLGGDELPLLDGYTGDQRFFMAWAQIWRNKYREDEVKRRLVTNSHAPAEFRTNGIVRNIDAWYRAFDVTDEDALYLPPEERVIIW